MSIDYGFIPTVHPIKMDTMFEIDVQFGKYTYICHSTKCMELNTWNKMHVFYAMQASMQ